VFWSSLFFFVLCLVFLCVVCFVGFFVCFWVGCGFGLVGCFFVVFWGVFFFLFFVVVWFFVVGLLVVVGGGFWCLLFFFVVWGLGVLFFVLFGGGVVFFFFFFFLSLFCFFLLWCPVIPLDSLSYGGFFFLTSSFLYLVGCFFPRSLSGRSLSLFPIDSSNVFLLSALVRITSS